MKENTAVKVNKITYLNRDRGYRFTDRDPDMEFVCDLIDKSGLSIGDIIENVLDVFNNSVHISYGCLSRWLDGTTKRPQNHTLTWVARGLGYTRHWRNPTPRRT